VRAPYNARPLSGESAVVSAVSTIDFASVRRQALWVVAGQVAVALCGGLICYLALDARAAISALLGGGIGAAATLVQVLVGLRNSAGKEPRAVMSGFYRGSVMKLIVTVVLFVLALKVLALGGRSPAPAPLFVTYVATFLVYWMALARTLQAGVRQETMADRNDRDL